MNTVLNFLSNLEVYYDKNYNAEQTRNLKAFLKRKDPTEDQLERMLTFLTENFLFLPGKKEISDCMIKLNITQEKADTGIPHLHPQSPRLQFYNNMHKDIEEILARYFRLRSEAQTRELKSYEISYLHEWEIIADVYNGARFQKKPKEECIKRADLALAEYRQIYGMQDQGRRRWQLDQMRQRFIPKIRVEVEVEAKSI